ENARFEALAIHADTDNDGIPNFWETRHGLNPNSASDAAGDPDGDGMTNLEEYKSDLSPIVANGEEDLDGDGYSNIFEVKNSSYANDRSSVPTADYVVDPLGSGTHTTIQSAIDAVSSDFEIIAVKAGVYAGV